MPRKSTVAELQAEESVVSSPLRRSSRKTSTTQENVPAPATPARATRGRRASAAQNNDEVIEVQATTPARVTKGRRTSNAAAQDNEEIVEVKPAPKSKRATILAEEEPKPGTPSRRGRKPSVTAEPATESAESEKPKPVKGRRTSTASAPSVTAEPANESAESEKPKPVKGRRTSTASAASETDQITLDVPKPASAVRGRRKSASVEPEVKEVPPKTPSRTTRRRTSVTAEPTPVEDVVTPAKRTTRGRRVSEDESQLVEKAPTPATRATRGRKPSVDKELLEESEKKSASKSLKKSKDADQTEKISELMSASAIEMSTKDELKHNADGAVDKPISSNESEILEINYVDELIEVSEISDTEDQSPTILKERVAKLTPIKKKKLEPLVSEIDLSVINESVDDADISKPEDALEAEYLKNPKESPPKKFTAESDKTSTTSGSSFASTTSSGNSFASGTSGSSDIQYIDSSSNSTLVAEPIKVNGDIPSPEKAKFLSAQNVSKEEQTLTTERNLTPIRGSLDSRETRRSRSLTPKSCPKEVVNDESRKLTPENKLNDSLAVKNSESPRRSPRLTSSKRHSLNESSTSNKEHNTDKSLNEKSVQANTAGETALAEKSLISNGSDGSFRLNLNMSFNNTAVESVDINDDLNNSKGSNGSDKENVDTSQVEKDKLNDLPSSAVSRISNVFKPNQKEFSFCEPMDVDQTVLNIASTINDKSLTNIINSDLEKEKTERSFLIQEETSVVFHIKSVTETGDRKSALGKPVDSITENSKYSPINSFSKAFEEINADKLKTAEKKRKSLDSPVLEPANQIEFADENTDTVKFKSPLKENLPIRQNETTIVEDSTNYEFEIPSEDEEEIIQKDITKKEDNEDSSMFVKENESTVTGAPCESTRFDFDVPPSDDDDDLLEKDNLSPICNSKILNKSFDKGTDMAAKFAENESSEINKLEQTTPRNKSNKSPITNKSTESIISETNLLNTKNDTAPNENVHSQTSSELADMKPIDVHLEDQKVNLKNIQEKLENSVTKVIDTEREQTVSETDQCGKRSLNPKSGEFSKLEKCEKIEQQKMESQEVPINKPLEGNSKNKDPDFDEEHDGTNEMINGRSSPRTSLNSSSVKKEDRKSKQDLEGKDNVESMNKSLKNVCQDNNSKNKEDKNDLDSKPDEKRFKDNDTNKDIERRFSKTPRNPLNSSSINKKGRQSEQSLEGDGNVKSVNNSLEDMSQDDNSKNQEEKNDLFDPDTDEENDDKNKNLKGRSTKSPRNSLNISSVNNSHQRQNLEANDNIAEVTSSSCEKSLAKEHKTPNIVIDEVEDPEPLSDNENKYDESDEDEEVNEFIDAMAEEGDEDTPSEGSNDIIDDGESIGSSDSEEHQDDDYENDSFVCDDEEQELLSGDEYDLDEDKKETTKKKKKTRIINLDQFDEDGINKVHSNTQPEEQSPKKRSRIITVSDSSEDEAETSEKINLEYTEDKKLTESKEAQTLIGRKYSGNYMNSEKTIVNQLKEAEVICLDSSIPTEAKASPDAKLNESEQSNTGLNSSVKTAVGVKENSPKRRRKSSINIYENLVLDGSKDSLSKRINSLVETFCHSIQGEVSLNLSLEFEDKTDSNTASTNQNLISPSKGINIISDIKIAPGSQSDDEKPSCSKVLGRSPKKKLSLNLDDHTSNEEAGKRKSKSPKKRMNVTLDDLSSDPASSPEEHIKKRRLSKSLDDVSQVKNKKKQKKRKKSKKDRSLTPNSVPSLENLKHTTFNLINGLVTDVKNRPRRTIKPTVPNTDFNSSWVTSSAKDIKPSKSPANQREKLELVSLKLHPKDFKNQMLVDSKRVRRVETRELIKKKCGY